MSGMHARIFSRASRLATALAMLMTVLSVASCAPAPEPRATTPSASEQSEPSGERTKPGSPGSAVEEPASEPAASPAIRVAVVSVTRIVDGDTIEVSMPNGSTEKVRFIGVDTPESTTAIEPFGKEASAFTAKALTGKTVYLETDVEQRDRYGRLLAHVWLEAPVEASDAEVRAKLFNAQLVLAGYANLMTIPPNVKYVDYLRAYEQEARTASAGLWAPAPATPPAAAPAPAPAPSAAAYIANRNTGKFHEASCSSVDDMNESNKVPYSSRDAAVAAGYVPCKRCYP